ncbi:MAG TPA: BTAD domain-containing putative transcriptional regulator [Gaiellaceae bacterium]|nr:BTAD domain-containing putative transcriptional regulator [Gaiellaceae bacterium]
MGGVRSSLRPNPRRSRSSRVVELRLLNSFELIDDGARVALPMSGQRLVAFVALHERSLRRAYVAGSLWPETSDQQAAANLRSTLWRVRCRSSTLLDASGQRLQLGPDVLVDLREAERLAWQELDGSAETGEPCDQRMFAGDLLPDWYDDWVPLERERFRQIRLRALDVLCERHARAGRITQALEAGLLSVAGEPLRESAHRGVVRVHLADANTGEALRQYRLCRKLLAEQLGVEPSEQMRRLVAGLEGMETER